MADNPQQPGLIGPESHEPKAAQYVADKVTNAVRLLDGHSQIPILVNETIGTTNQGYQDVSSVFDNTNWKGATFIIDALYLAGTTPFQAELWATWYLDPRAYTENESSPFYCLMRSPVINQDMRLNMTIYPGAAEIPFISTNGVIPRYFWWQFYTHDAVARTIEVQVNANMLI